ncbi:glycosyltransferase [Phycisphaeraceae bacterium D3-23]
MTTQDANADAGRRYCLITPCRDEARYARRTLDAVTRQTVPPSLWVIVDDGSTDETPAILAEYARRFDYIRVVRRDDRGGRAVGPGVIEAFYHGYDTIDPAQFDYVCKFDLDLDLPHAYFAALMQRMEENPRIGTCSGKPYFPPIGTEDDDRRNDAGFFDTSDLISEACGDEMSVGMIKFYRTACFEQIGGFVRQVMWDGIDCHRCRMLGWIACSWDDPALRFIHLRAMGSSQKGILTGRMRHGFGQWFMGTGLGYMSASALFRLSRPPVLIGGVAMWWGYVRSMLRREPRFGDVVFRRFLRRYQRACLFKGKSAATRQLDARQAEVWEPPADVPHPNTPSTTNQSNETNRSAGQTAGNATGSPA